MICATIRTGRCSQVTPTFDPDSPARLSKHGVPHSGSQVVFVCKTSEFWFTRKVSMKTIQFVHAILCKTNTSYRVLRTRYETSFSVASSEGEGLRVEYVTQVLFDEEASCISPMGLRLPVLTCARTVFPHASRNEVPRGGYPLNSPTAC